MYQAKSSDHYFGETHELDALKIIILILIILFCSAHMLNENAIRHTAKEKGYLSADSFVESGQNLPPNTLEDY